MLLPVVLVLSTLPQGAISMECGNAVEIEQQLPAPSVSATNAVLSIRSEDDHSKDSHECEATYKLLLSNASSDSQEIKLLTSDADWGRRLSARFDGVSSDGRLFGMLSEGGRYRWTALFSYSLKDGSVQLFDHLEKSFSGVSVESRCPGVRVVGITADGSIVLRRVSARACSHGSLWLIGPRQDRAHPRFLPPDAAYLPLGQDGGAQ